MAGEEILMAGGLGALMALFAGMMFILFLIFIGLYIYTGFAFMAIAKKAKLATPGLAWIPAIGPMIIAYQASKMHWWPWLLFIGVVIPFLNILAGIALLVFFIIWLWKTYEAINKPNWWAVLWIISPVGLIMAGIAAWSQD